MILRHLEALFSILFPAECQKCYIGLAPEEKKMCRGCLESIAQYRFALSDAWQQPSLPSIRTVWSIFPYKGEIKDLLQRVKFKKEFYLLEAMAKIAAGPFQAAVSDIYYDALIPMPVTWQRRLFRRFNQSEIFADCLQRYTSVPVKKNLLVRKLDSSPQSSLTRDERRWNVFGAFQAKHVRQIAGRSFLIIDDIITTGTTAQEAARVLLNAGAKRVDLFTLARSSYTPSPSKLSPQELHS